MDDADGQGGYDRLLSGIVPLNRYPARKSLLGAR
jgi:hypothetical protein